MERTVILKQTAGPTVSETISLTVLVEMPVVFLILLLFYHLQTDKLTRIEIFKYKRVESRDNSSDIIKISQSKNITILFLQNTDLVLCKNV